MAALACQPDTLDPGLTATDRFASAAAVADPARLYDLLGPVLSASTLVPRAETAIAALRALRPRIAERLRW